MNLSVHINLQPTIIKFHHHLAEIVVSNLLNNATRYNKPGGAVDIELRDRVLTVSNTSGRPQLDGSRLFKRFYRDANAEEGTGLGLSIVKQICDLAGYSVNYSYADGSHVFSIHF